MPLIRFECSLDATGPVMRQSLEAARDRFVAGNAVDFADDANLCPRLPVQLPFFALPEQQLLAYEKHRESSELGHIFRIANGLHDFIDALVTVGSGAGCAGARALAQACCDPHHNELSRAARGSKPRIYFTEQASDNDQLQSLMGRLLAGGYGDGPGEKAWATIAVDSALPSDSDPAVLEHLVALLGREDARVDSQLRSRLITSIGHEGSRLSARLSALGFEQSLFVPENLPDAFRVLTPVGLLSSAFLGLDCIQLLVGAAAINENFRNEPFASNIVLQFVAANRPDVRTAFAWWARSLRGFSPWLAHLRPGKVSFDLAVAAERDALLEQIQSGNYSSVLGGEIVCNHVDVDEIRTDPLPATPALVSNGDRTVDTLTKFQRTMLDQARRQLSDAGLVQNTIVLPVIDTHSLGQLMQMMMLATAVEQSLASDLGPKPGSENQVP